ncbi:MAG: hypothetical protein JSS51_01420 [Planctomycetes bacterium]|nr:hypothetical protein [Planctomycetota bacterium]
MTTKTPRKLASQTTPFRVSAPPAAAATGPTLADFTPILDRLRKANPDHAVAAMRAFRERNDPAEPVAVLLLDDIRTVYRMLEAVREEATELEATVDRANWHQHTERVKQLEADVVRLTGSISGYREAIERGDTHLTDLKAKAASAEADRKIASLKTDIDSDEALAALHAERAALLSQVAGLESRLATYTTAKNRALEAQELLRVAESDWVHNSARMRSTIESEQTQIKSAKSEIATLREKVELGTADGDRLNLLRGILSSVDMQLDAATDPRLRTPV